MRFTKIIILFIFIFIVNSLHAQNDKQQLLSATIIDTTPKVVRSDSLPVTKDSLAKKKHNPHKATLYSAILPGWGQAYNREYWKIPIVYGALAVPAVTFLYNNKWYKKTRDAYEIVV